MPGFRYTGPRNTAILTQYWIYVLIVLGFAEKRRDIIADVLSMRVSVLNVSVFCALCGRGHISEDSRRFFICRLAECGRD